MSPEDEDDWGLLTPCEGDIIGSVFTILVSPPSLLCVEERRSAKRHENLKPTKIL